MANGIVLGGSLRCRKTPASTGAVWGSFSNGTVLTVTNSSDADWYQTTWNGSVGYVMKSFVAVANDTVKVNATNVNVRDEPSTSGTTVLYRLSSPTTATVVSVTSNWVKIQPSGKSAGWIHADYVDKSASGSSSGGGSGDITDDGHTGDASAYYTGAKCIGNIYVYERNNPYDVVVLQYYGLLSGDVNVTDAGSTEWLNYSHDGMLYRKQVDITYCKKPATTTMGSATLKNGSSGRYVYHLQHYLNRYLSSRNYAKMTVDGQFGNTTKAKVESFQQYWNANHTTKLDVDGIVGNNTRNALAQYVHSL